MDGTDFAQRSQDGKEHLSRVRWCKGIQEKTRAVFEAGAQAKTTDEESRELPDTAGDKTKVVGKGLHMPGWYGFGRAAERGEVRENATSCDEEYLERHGRFG